MWQVFFALCCPIVDVDSGILIANEMRVVGLQPFEEAAFLAFSRIEPGLSAKETAAQHSRVFAISVRCVAIVGGLRSPPHHVAVAIPFPTEP